MNNLKKTPPFLKFCNLVVKPVVLQAVHKYIVSVHPRFSFRCLLVWTPLARYYLRDCSVVYLCVHSSAALHPSVSWWPSYYTWSVIQLPRSTDERRTRYRRMRSLAKGNSGRWHPRNFSTKHMRRADSREDVSTASTRVPAYMNETDMAYFPCPVDKIERKY
jgi:hypothetical protein